MYTKIAIFGVISALLVAAIYSSSTAFAIKSCFVSKDNELKICYDTVGDEWLECWSGWFGGWNCELMELVMDTSLPPELKDAIDVATGDTQSNDTKVPKTGILDEPGALSDDESTENDDDTKVPKDPGGLNNDNGPTINPEE